MMISKTRTFEMLRILCILCAIGMGFMTLVGTSEDDATDAAGIDDSFEGDVDMSLDPVTASKSSTLSIQADNDCKTITINEALEAVKDQIENYDKLDIKSVKLDYVGGSYTDATWTPLSVPSFGCQLDITGALGNISVAEKTVNGGSGTLDTVLEQADIDVINDYLDNRNEPFTYCLVCTDAELDTYSVTYNVDIGVTVKGDVDVF
jgi:hypothetical protein